ncbi:MAG: hypothetical protein GY950_36520, partial [bacterium]|nr:hypothetical protein [bacterium]
MTDKADISDFVETISTFLTDYIKTQLKTEPVLDLVSQIVDQSDKSPGDALIVFVSAVKYLWGGKNAFAEMETQDAFQEFVRTKRDGIIKLVVERRQQFNFPTRAFPIIEVINKKLKDVPVVVIELGASYGLLGWGLLEPARIIEKRDRYFPPEQKLPLNPRPIDKYLGIEIEIPEEEWLLACIWEHASECYMRDIKADVFHDTDKFELVETSAFGFAGLDAVKRLVAQPVQIVVLTSFVLFQIGEEKAKKLKAEILEFTANTGSHWISQVVKHSSVSTDCRYYVEWNGERVIELSDALCSDWKW